jgi:hypothetical protein
MRAEVHRFYRRFLLKRISAPDKNTAIRAAEISSGEVSVFFAVSAVSKETFFETNSNGFTLSEDGKIPKMNKIPTKPAL